nr:unnamed protein product [Spirometra erinaceieuropaei]
MIRVKPASLSLQKTFQPRALTVFFRGNAPEDVTHVEISHTGLSPKGKVLMSFALVLSNEEGLCRSFDATFAKTEEPQTLRLYTDFVPDRVRIGTLELNLGENDCIYENQVYSCRLIQVHESGFWSFEIDGIVTADLKNVVLSSDSEYIPPVAIQARPLADKVEDNIFLRSSAPFVICPRLEQKGVDVDFVFPASILDQSVKPQTVVIGHAYTFTKNKCQSENEVLQCKLTNVPGSNIFKFEIFNVSKRDIQTIRFANSDVKSPQFYILYRKLLTSLPQFLFSPEFSAPFVHCPSPASYYTDVSCTTFHKQPLAKKTSMKHGPISASFTTGPTKATQARTTSMPSWISSRR